MARGNPYFSYKDSGWHWIDENDKEHGPFESAEQALGNMREYEVMIRGEVQDHG